MEKIVRADTYVLMKERTLQFLLGLVIALLVLCVGEAICISALYSAAPVIRYDARDASHGGGGGEFGKELR